MIRELDIIKGESSTKHDSVFVGYVAEVFSTNHVENYYYHVKLLEPEATHIMCAFKLPGIDFTKVEGAIDDGEFAAGRTLLNFLYKHKEINKAIFVARYYGGKHLGPQRFLAIEQAADSALTALNNFKQQIRRPPTQQELQEAVNSMPLHSNPVWGATTDEDEDKEDSQLDSQAEEEI